MSGFIIEYTTYYLILVDFLSIRLRNLDQPRGLGRTPCTGMQGFCDNDIINIEAGLESNEI